MKTKENVTYEEEPIAEGALTELYSLLEALESLSAEVKAASKVLSDLEHSARILSEETIPAHMEELGLGVSHAQWEEGKDPQEGFCQHGPEERSAASP